MKTCIQLITGSAYRVVDVCEELLEEVPQSAQVKAGVFTSVRTVRLSPNYNFLQPELHLLDTRLRLDVGLLKLDQ